MYKKHTQKGFTLIELLVVIAIIGVLSAIGLTALANSQAKARDAKRRADLHSIGSSLSEYLDDNTTFPTADPALTGADQGPVWIGDTTTSPTPTFRAAMTAANIAIPNSPQMGTMAADKDYWYVSDATSLIYALFTKLEAGGDWFVYNSRGWSDTIQDTDTIADVPVSTNTECTDTLNASGLGGGLHFSPCLTEPVIQ